jgi:transposase-like protein
MAQTSCPFCSFGRSWCVRGKKRKCKQCRREFSGKIYPVSGFRLEKEDWKKIVGIFLKERTSKRLQEEMSLSEKSARKVTHHLRVVMATEIPPVFAGIVEMDETYIGGQRKNKKLHIRRIKGKRGHGTDKLPIVGLFCRDSGQVFVDVEPKKLDVHYIFQTIQERVTPGSKVYTDGFKMYRGLSQLGYIHEFVDHAHDEYVRGDIHTNNIEGFWGILKRKMSCIGGMRRNRLHLFVGEIVWRFNHRKEPRKEQERALFALVLLN